MRCVKTRLPVLAVMIERRVDMAKTYLLHSDLPLADIAVRCGFGEQSALNEVFRGLSKQGCSEWCALKSEVSNWWF
ncbi:helix-turn-helix domain-containing protein [Tunturiibacter gelidoferens]|uniref:helix-turn-helix domain-containing protein n=1 Tax=Tunturiibacter gelidiferens TaxID=3069689 RepID=UPI0028C4091B|nr:helix-turn-helix domain-containing protein [Edaphobacter lichenicola]